MINHPRHKEGFTIIETLIAVAILMIAIAGPLVAASRGLSAALYAKDQLVASALAQEGMELIRNAKDIAIFTDPSGDPGIGFSSFFSSSSYGKCISGANQMCGIWVTDSSSVYPSYALCTTISDCLLYENTSGTAVQDINIFTGASGYMPTLFTRQFYVSAVNSGEVQVTVIVSWKEKTIQSNVTLTSEMTGSII